MNGTISTRERLARKQKALHNKSEQKTTATSVEQDSLHNLDTPNCHLLQEAALDILPTSTKNQEESSLLAILTRRHLLEAASSSSTSASKKKKKRKKKKKNTGETTTETATSQMATLEGTEQDQGNTAASSILRDEPPSAPQDQTPPQDQASPPPFQAHDIFQHWLQQQPPESLSLSDDGSSYKNRELLAFLEHIAHCPVELNYNQARHAVEAISCDACKQVASSHFWRQGNDTIVVAPSSMSLPRESPLHIPGGIIHEVDRAFDYVAMEEGDAWKDAILTFHHARDGLLQSTHGLSVSQYDTLIHDLILTHGYNKEPSMSIWKDQIADILSSVKGEEAAMVSKLRNMEQRLATFLAQVQETVVGPQFDVKSSTLLQEGNEMLDEDLQTLINMVRMLSKACYDSSFQRDTTLVQCIEEVYPWVAETISAILDAQLGHAARILQLSSRPGCVPQLALNAQHRFSFRTMLMTKIMMLQDLRRQIETIFVEKRVFRQVWVRKAMDNIGPTSPDIAHEYDAIWKAAAEMTHTISCGNVQELKQQQVDRTTEWFDEVLAVKSGISTDIPAHVSGPYDRLLEDAMRLQTIVINQDDEDAREEAIPQYAHAVYAVFRNVWDQVLYTKRDSKPLSHENNMAHIPPELMAFMKGNESSVRVGPCQGGGGQRRTTGIVVGLVYQWLKDRCSEWHAELTQNELLESMMNEEPAEGSKPAKSKKSKKKRDTERKSSAAADGETPSKSIQLEETRKEVKSIDKNDARETTDTGVEVAVDSNGSDGERKRAVASALEKESETAAGEVREPSIETGTHADLNGSDGTTDESIEKLVAAIDNVHRENEAEKWETVDKRSKKAGTVSKSVERGVHEGGRKDTNEKCTEKTYVSKDTVGPPVSNDTVDHGTSLVASSRIYIENAKNISSLKETGSRGTKAAEASKENTGLSELVSKPVNGTAKEEMKSQNRTKPTTTVLAQKTSNSPATTAEQGVDGTGSLTKADSRKLSPRKRSLPLPASVDVGVVSSTGFQSAEGFLVQRLMAVMKAEGRKNNETRGR